jgi:hypothetical protein
VWQNNETGAHCKELYQSLIVLLPEGYVIDSLLLFFMVLTVRVKIRHITLKFAFCAAKRY